MIEYILVFVAGICYGLAGAGVARKIQMPLNAALMDYGIPPSSLWAVYASLMVALLWPVLAVLILVTAGYATLRGAGE